MTNTNGDRPHSGRGVNRVREGALSLARRGIPVFPCRKEDKSPHFKVGLIEHGFKDATTDPETVIRFWTEWPDALIGVPMGRETDRYVVDIDVRVDFDGLAELKRLERRFGPLPKTLTIFTPNGEHHYFLHPGFDVLNRTGPNAIAPGVEVKGDGGYVIAPNSPGYRAKIVAPLAEAPSWLLGEILNRKADIPEAEVPLPAVRSPHSFLEGDPIESGGRNCALFSLAIKARRCGVEGYSLGALMSDVNRVRCVPPLSEREVEKVVRSARRYTLRRCPLSRRAEGLLTRLRELLETRLWHGMAGKTDRSLLRALVELADSIGKETAEGVIISISVRDLALFVALGTNTIATSTGRLKGAGLVERKIEKLKARESGAWLLPFSPLHEGKGEGEQDRHTRTTDRVTDSHEGTSVSNLVACTALEPEKLPFLRWGAGALGKSLEELLHVLRERGEMLVEDLAGINGKLEPGAFRRRHLNPLVEMGVVTLDDAKRRCALAPGWYEALREVRNSNGEVATERRAAMRFEIERECYEEHLSHSETQKKGRKAGGPVSEGSRAGETKDGPGRPAGGSDDAPIHSPGPSGSPGSSTLPAGGGEEELR